MGTRQEMKAAAEYDVVYNRGVYCYLQQKGQVRFWKRHMRRRRRHVARVELKMGVER